MTKMRRLLAVVALVGVAALVSSSSRGQQGKKSGPAGPAVTPQNTPAVQVSQLAEPAGESRFNIPGTITYQPVKGDLYFAMKLKPALEPVPQRPRDILIMVSTAATQAGASWIAGHQIADGVIDAAREFDRVSVWTVNEPKFTRNLTKEFLFPKDFADGKRLREAMTKYRAGEFPAGNTDLKNALAAAMETFDSFKSSKDRQRILLFLGDGLSTHNPMSEDDRLAIAKKLVERKIAFFPVPLGLRLDPNTLHGLATSTGGAVLRTQIEAEKLVDVLKRYEEAFAAPVLYSAKLQLPADMIDVCPTKLPPLRGDSPTLVVGRMKKAAQQFDFTVTGIIAGREGEVALKATEKVQTPNLDNYFLVGLIDQWAKAKDYPAVLRADRSLTFAYEQTRLQHMDCLENAQMALQDNHLEAAHRLFKQAAYIAPHDGQAEAGIKIVDRLKDGTLDKNKIRRELEKRTGKVDQLKIVDGKPRWVKVDLIQLAQNDDKLPMGEKKQPGVEPKQGINAPENLLKEHRDRQAVEEQKVRQTVDDAIQQARRTLAADPDGTLENLRNLATFVKNQPDLGALVRDALGARLQTALRDSAVDVQRIKLKKLDNIQAEAVTQQNLIREQERRSFEDRVDAQFRLYKNLMTVARLEETRRITSDIMEAMVRIQDEARQKGHAVPMATKAMYDIALAAHPLQTHNTLVRRREDKWLAVLMQVEKSHVPQPDEPGIVFPPLKTWKALINARKDKYEVTTLPDDPKGREKANAISRLLETPMNTKGLQDVTLKDFLDIFGVFLNAKARNITASGSKEQLFPDGVIPIVVFQDAFIADPGRGADAPDPYTEKITLPQEVGKIPMHLALRLALSQLKGDGATYMIRREFIEITTNKRYLEDKVISVHYVGDLVIPVQPALGGMMMAGGGMMMGGMGMGGMQGMMMGGMPGMMGGGMMGGMPGMMMGGMPGMMMGGMPGMMGGGMPGMMMGGMPGMMGGGYGGMMMGGGLQMAGGTPGAMGAYDQGQILIQMITNIIDTKNWIQPVPPPQPMGGFMMGGFMMGGGMMIGMVGGAGPIGAGPPPDPNANVDPQTANSIAFYQPALALIVRAPSRIHTSITGGIIGGKARSLEKAAMLEIERNGLAKFQKDNPEILKNNPRIQVAAGKFNDKNPNVLVKNPQRADLDPAKIWNESFAKGGINPGLVIATADFLFEAGEFKHAAEFLKANLRHGVVVRPWVFESLAVALEASGGTPEDIQRVRLSGIALDPQDAQGFMSAARAVADRGQYDRALAFCKQAALLEPNDYHPYEVALAYAETSKDSQAMEWAVGKLVSQDWPVDNLFIQKMATRRLSSLATTLKTEKRGAEAKTLETALARLNQRDLRVKLIWDNAGGPCELEMSVKEPSASVCSLEQKQSPSGGIMIGYNLTDKVPNTEYVVAQAFPGEYEITVSRVYGEPLNNRARLEIITHGGTPQQSRRIETVRLDQNMTFKVNLQEGRRTELATVSQAANQRHEPMRTAKEQRSAFNELRALANPSFFGSTISGPRGSAGATGQRPSVASLAAKDSKNKPSAPIPVMQNAINPTNGGVPMTAQVRLNPDQRNYDLVIRPFFNAANAASNRPAVNLSAIPGGGR